jgi:hypothetical protein
MKLYTLLGAVLVMVMLAAARCGAVPEDGPSSASGVKIVDPSLRTSTQNGVIYLTLVNDGSTDDELVSVETNAAEAVEMHETTIDENGVMRMGPATGFEVPAGGLVRLEPGGKHIMLINVKEGLSRGDEIDLTFNFEQAGPLVLKVVIEAGPTGHDDNHAQGEHAEDMSHDERK